MKPRLYIHLAGATHFLHWELPYFQKYFDVVDYPDKNTVLFVFGPDALVSGAELPAMLRVILLFPGFGYHPYYDVIQRLGMQQILNERYNIVFTNHGPMYEAFKKSVNNMHLCSFSVNTDLIKLRRYRDKINTLLHASAVGFAQKDWTRSRDVMHLTKLPYEVFPPRNKRFYHRIIDRLGRKIKSIVGKTSGQVASPQIKHRGYVSHAELIEKYHQYDGFVHIAGKTPPHTDAKYTATLLEAGLTGCILFWHDTLNLGNDFETIFSLPLEPALAAQEILQIRKSIDVALHSKRTAEEIYDRTNPDKIVKQRLQVILEHLG